MFLGVRLAMVCLGLLLGLLLLARGNVLIGGIIVLMASLRLVMVIGRRRMIRRRSARRASRGY